MIEAQRALADVWLEGHAEVADELRTRVDAALVALAREREAWYQSAAEFSRNADWYAGLLDVIGKLFGDAARTADDGSLQDSVLRAKVPELVQAAVTSAEVDAARVRVMRRMLDTILHYERQDAQVTGSAVRAGVAHAIRSVMQAAPVDAAVAADANGGPDGAVLFAAMESAYPERTTPAEVVKAIVMGELRAQGHQLRREAREN